MSDYKYKTSFSQHIIGAHTISRLDFLEKNSLASYFSEASLDGLSSLIPKDIDLDKNIDLVATAFNAALVNSFNKNGDGIDSRVALAIKDYFVHKPTNIEHKKQKVVGHIVSAAFSSFGDNEIISDQEALKKNDPYNIALGAVVYKTVNKAFAELLEANEEEGYLESVSASWELGFNNYAIAIGGENLEDSEVIYDQGKIKEFDKYLRANDGPGHLDDGTKVNRLIIGDIFPLGIGYTMNPAANVKGLYVKKDGGMVHDKNSNSTELTEKISHINKKDVITTQEENSVMDNKEILTKLEEVASSQKFSEEAVASISQIVRDAIREKSEQYVKERDAIEAEKAALQEAEDKMKSEAQELAEKLTSAQEQIDKLQAEQDAAKAQQVFNSRMEVIDTSYDLAEEDRQVLATELTALDVTDEAFAEYKEKLEIMWKHKNKDFIKTQEEAIQKRIDDAVEQKVAELASAKSSEASEEPQQQEVQEEVKDDNLEEALENAEAVSQEVPSNNGESVEKELTLKERFSNLFNRDNINVTY